ncbi:uncharacterized protein LOC129619099 [Condylostylus longicornis]|uniref:uncharacterized protein LOC129619099 n=1 Tax=Condylostylus longicornis TaxID=2530218 RepID=UPI00244E56EA|nr:uncharacterized protein LOC129619099 [Condylostylus longicornis]
MFNKIYYLIGCLTILICLLPKDEAKQLPDSLKKCDRQNPECMRNTTETVLRIWDELPSEFNLPSINPLKIDKLQLKKEGNADFQFNAKYHDILLYGSNNIRILEFTGDIENGIHAKGFIPVYNVTCDYILSGKLLLFQFKGRGTGGLILTNTTIDSWLYFEKFNGDDGEEYIKLKEAKVDLAPKKIEVIVHNDPKDINPEISKLLETSINENAFALWEEFEPVFNKNLAKVFISYVNKFISQVPLKDLFLN